MKTKLVVFTSNNARILVNANPEEFPMAMVNPDMSAVKRVAPHFWKREGDKIVEMTPPEKEARLAHHAQHGVDNELRQEKQAPKEKPRYRRPIDPKWWVVLAAGSGYLMGWVTHLHG